MMPSITQMASGSGSAASSNSGSTSQDITAIHTDLDKIVADLTASNATASK